MATIKFEGIEEYSDLLKKFANRAEQIIKPAVYDGAAVVVKEAKKQLKRVVSDNSTGDLSDSMGLSAMRSDNGFVHTKIGFDGYDRNGHPNVVKARALESGTSKQQKTPFLRPAVKASQDEAVEVMRQTVDRTIKAILKEEG